MLETRYIELSEKIETGIKNGLWRQRLPGVIKLSKELAADPATVAKAFKVLAAKGLVTINGKKGTFIAQPGVKTKHRIIGLVGIDAEITSRYDEFKEIEEIAGKNNYRVIGITHNSNFFENDINMLLQFPVDGYIFMYSSLTFKIAAFLRQNGIKFVSSNRPMEIPGVHWVDFDSESGLRLGFDHLIRLGHEKIAYIEFHNRNYRYSDRMLSTYKELCREHDLQFNEKFYKSGDSAPYYKHYGDDYERAYGLDCATELVKSSERPTAVIITSSVNMLGGFRQGLAMHDIKVPEDISVLSYADKNKNENFFSNVYLDHKKRAIRAIEILLDLLNDSEMSIKQELIKAELFIRKSTAPLNPNRSNKEKP